MRITRVVLTAAAVLTGLVTAPPTAHAVTVAPVITA
jgi:hypothetical protein